MGNRGPGPLFSSREAVHVWVLCKDIARADAVSGRQCQILR